MHTRLLLCIAVLGIASVAYAFDARAPLDVDLSGRWTLNATLSDDVDAVLLKRLEKQRKRERRWLEEDRAADPDAPPSPMPEPGPGPGANRVLAQMREVLALYPAFEIRQSDGGAKLEILAKDSARRFTSGDRTLVSMPGGALAASEVGWDGQWFVIDRKVRKGPRVVEKFRLSKKTGQLEATLVWRGASDDLLSGIKLRRVFDRTEAAPPPEDPDSGPVR